MSEDIDQEALDEALSVDDKEVVKDVKKVVKKVVKTEEMDYETTVIEADKKMEEDFDW